MSTVYAKCLQILNQKNEKLIPENLKKDIIIYDIKGTLETLDTSDATATASDIVQGKTAYISNNKITGTLERAGSITCTSDIIRVVQAGESYTEGDLIVDFSYAAGCYREGDKFVFDKGQDAHIHIDGSLIADTIGLTSDKLKKGETIFGVTGTLEGDSTVYEQITPNFARNLALLRTSYEGTGDFEGLKFYVLKADTTFNQGGYVGIQLIVENISYSGSVDRQVLSFLEFLDENDTVLQSFNGFSVYIPAIGNVDYKYSSMSTSWQVSENLPDWMTKAVKFRITKK